MVIENAPIGLIENRQRYLDLMKRCLMNTIYSDSEYKTIAMKRGIRPLLGKVLKALRLELVRKADPELRAEGIIWPLSAHTMIGQKRLDNLQSCVEQAIQGHVPGDLIEAGVWRGGATILMKAVLEAYGITDRCVYVADSFQGLPKPTHEVDKRDPNNDFYKDAQLSVSLERVQANFRAYNLLDEHVKFVKGWFGDTLPTLSASKWAVIRLDGDLYESVMDGLVHLYPQLSVGGFLIVDDYNFPGCKQAVDEYRNKNKIQEAIRSIDWSGVYWQRKV